MAPPDNGTFRASADRPFVERLAAGLYRERYRIDMALSHAPYPQLILDTAALDVARLFRITYQRPDGHPSVQYRWIRHGYVINFVTG